MAHINSKQLERFQKFVQSLSDEGIPGINFSPEGPFARIIPELHPHINHPQAINYFSFLGIHNFGFWYGDEHGYVQPLYGSVHGKEMPKLKGSELLARALKRALDKDETIFEPSRLAVITPHDLAYCVFADDSGAPIPFPDFEVRFQLTRAYGQWFLEKETSPEEIVARSNAAEKPLAAFLEMIRQIPGYDEDSFEKKNMLLASSLESRPENFLHVTDPESWCGIIDYHLMRLGLRLGIIQLEEDEQADNILRRWVLPQVEEGIRSCMYEAMNELIDHSGKTAAWLDQLFWFGRKFCPEMTTPNCGACPLSPACLKRTALFQPVLRTTAY